MKAYGAAARAALQLLTRLPVPPSRGQIGADAEAQTQAAGRAPIFYPWVGLLIGTLLAVAANLATSALPPLMSAALLISLWVAITGALHLDGLADCADGWAGGHRDPAAIRQIMKDPHCGTSAVVVLILVLMLKLAALATLLPGLPMALWFVPLLARAAVLPALLTMPYESPGGMADAIARYLPRVQTRYSLLAALLLTSLILPFTQFLVLLAAAIGVFALWRRAVLGKLRGYTGDTLGALIELTELALLLALVAAQPVLR